VVAACGILCCGFSSSWSGVELRVMRPVCRMLQHGQNHIKILQVTYFYSNGITTFFHHFC